MFACAWVRVRARVLVRIRVHLLTDSLLLVHAYMHTLRRSLTRSLTHAFTHSLTLSTHAPTHSPTHSHTHSSRTLANSLLIYAQVITSHKAREEEFHLAFARAKEQTEAREQYFADLKGQFDEMQSSFERCVCVCV